MNKNLKRIIAREGLIILGIIGVALLVYNIGIIYSYFYKPPYRTPIPIVQGKPIDFSDLLTTEELFGHRPLINEIASWILFYLYPLYLVVRFIIWAIKTLEINVLTFKLIFKNRIVRKVLFTIAIFIVISSIVGLVIHIRHNKIAQQKIENERQTQMVKTEIEQQRKIEYEKRKQVELQERERRRQLTQQQRLEKEKLDAQYLKNIEIISSETNYAKGDLLSIPYLFITIKNNGNRFINSLIVHCSSYDYERFVIKEKDVELQSILPYEEKRFKIDILDMGKYYTNFLEVHRLANVETKLVSCKVF